MLLPGLAGREVHAQDTVPEPVRHLSHPPLV
jgi:hypothetical protein